MGKKTDKTNVMRILDGRKIKYSHHVYDDTLLNAADVAGALGIDAGRLFKTLVTVGGSKAHYVFMIPAGKELDLKKAADAAGEKSLDMLPQKELLPLTGYVHGGCSPIGMKKQFRTFIDNSAAGSICFSGGRAGCQIEMEADDLRRVIDIEPVDATKNPGKR